MLPEGKEFSIQLHGVQHTYSLDGLTQLRLRNAEVMVIEARGYRQQRIDHMAAVAQGEAAPRTRRVVADPIELYLVAVEQAIRAQKGKGGEIIRFGPYVGTADIPIQHPLTEAFHSLETKTNKLVTTIRNKGISQGAFATAYNEYASLLSEHVHLSAQREAYMAEHTDEAIRRSVPNDSLLEAVHTIDVFDVVGAIHLVGLYPLLKARFGEERVTRSLEKSTVFTWEDIAWLRLRAGKDIQDRRGQLLVARGLLQRVMHDMSILAALGLQVTDKASFIRTRSVLQKTLSQMSFHHIADVLAPSQRGRFTDALVGRMQQAITAQKTAYDQNLAHS